MRAPHIFQTDNGGEFTINLLNTTLRNDGYRYFLLIVELFSHYVEAIPLKDQTATSIVNAFMEGWVYCGDGMTERHVDFVNQVIRCLMLERYLEKGCWPSLLQEITFYCNYLDNASSKISPHMLAFGRQPRAPIDMLISTGNTPTKVTGSSSQFLETTVKKRQDE